MSLVFFGTAEFAVRSLEALVREGHPVLAVVTQPDRPQGRRRVPAASPIKIAAHRLGLQVLQPERVRDQAFVETIRAMRPESLALAAFGQIIPQSLLDIPPLGPINVHASLLPQYRGAAPVQRAIMAGETQTGVTTMWMDASLDTGDTLLAEAIPIDAEDTAGTLGAKLAPVGARLLIATIRGLAGGTIRREPQDSANASIAPRITAEDTVLRWSQPAEVSRNRIRGLAPRPGAVAAIDGKRIKVWHATAEADAGAAAVAPGTVLSESARELRVAAAGGTALALLDVQPDSGRRMSAADWARGSRVRPGDRFTESETTPR